MTRFGAHAFVWTASWEPDSAERAVRAAAEGGLDFIEIPLLRPQSFDVAGTRALLQRHELGVRCSLGLPPGATFTDDPEAAVAFLEGALEVAAALGSPVLTGVLYASLGVLPGRPPEEEERRRMVEGLRRAARRAGALGLRLGIEPVNRYETHLINLAEQGLEVLDAIDDDAAFLHLDTYHMNIEEKGFAGPIIRAGERLGYIHLSESDRGVPGSGNVHWDEVFRGLAAIDYRGDLVLESFAAVNPDIARATCIWRPVAPDGATLIREGATFLREKAAAHGLR